MSEFDTQVRAVKQFAWGDEIEFYMRVRQPGDKARFGKCVLETIEDGLGAPPLMRLQPREAQVLMDDLWQCGIRPTEGAGSAGAMAATVRHLEDMRLLVFEREWKPKMKAG